MKKSPNIENKLIPSGFLVLLILAWEFICDGGYIEKFLLPSPRDILVSFCSIWPEITGDLETTLLEAAIGLGAAIVLAVVLAVIMDNVPVIKKAFYPLLIISQTIPIIALAPLFIVWFGFGILPKVIVVVLVSFFPIVVSLLDGLASVDGDLLKMLQSMGADKIQIFRIVKFPAALMNFFSGLRIAATYSIMGAVIGEWLGGEAGLGVYMIRVKQSYALDKMFAVILLIVLLSMLLFKLISIIEKVLMPWQKYLKTN